MGVSLRSKSRAVATVKAADTDSFLTSMPRTTNVAGSILLSSRQISVIERVRMLVFQIPAHVETVFFDIDGTLFDHRRAADLAVTRFAHEHGTVDSQRAIRLWNDMEQKYFPRFERGELTFTDQRRARMREFIGEDDMSDDELDAMFSDYYVYYHDNWTSFPDVPAALSRCEDAHLIIGVISNGDHAQQLDKLRRIGIDLDDDKVLTSDRLGFAKPDQRAFLTACTLMRTKPENSLMIGDDSVDDYDGARAAGLLAVLVDRSGCGGTDVVTSLDEIQC